MKCIKINCLKILPSLLLFLGFHAAHAQIDTSLTGRKMDFKTYLQQVSQRNLEYAAQKFNVNIAEAGIEAAKVFPDPVLSIGWTDSREGNASTGKTWSYEVGKTLELGGKRHARIDLAKSIGLLAKARLEDFFRNLRADASLVWLEALKQTSLYKVKYDSWKVMKQLSEADSVRLSLGSIMEIDAAQSKLEAGIQLNDLTEAESSWRNSFTRIALMTGNVKSDSLLSPSGSLDIPCRQFRMDDLINTALNNRADLVAALYDKQVSEKSLTLAKKQRILDLDMSIGYENDYFTTPGTPKASAITAGVAIPLKFSNLYKGDIKAARFQVIQSESLYRQAELLIKTEISEAWQRYQAFCLQVERYDNGLLAKAMQVRKGKIYSYSRGESSLLEVLNAQRVYNDTQSDYIETLYNRAAALVELEKAAGIWDIDF